MKPEWRLLLANQSFEAYWCRGCGCVKIVKLCAPQEKAKYLVPKREKERRQQKKKVNK